MSSRLLSARRALTTGLAAVLALGALATVSAPAHATTVTVATYGSLELQMSNCESVTTVRLGADLTSETNELQALCTQTLDLNGHRLSVRQLTLVGGRTLTITDTSGGGALVANTSGHNYTAAIRTVGAALVINGGHVKATGGYGGAGIGAETPRTGGPVTINGGHVEATGGAHGAGIQTTRTTLVVNDGSLTAHGGHDMAAGIGGHAGYGGGTVTINGGHVKANGSDYGAGIGGGGNGGAGGVTLVNGGTVEATGGQNAAGIGGGHAGAGGSTTIAGGSVTATGGPSGAGIGGGAYGAGGAVTISDGNITAVGNGWAAGIGGGVAAGGGTVDIRGGVVSASGPDSAIGPGLGSASFGTLSVAGTLRLPSGQLRVPNSNVSAPEITVTETGKILGDVDTPTTGATFTGNGDITNDGIIALDPVGTSNGTLTVIGHHHLVTFDGNGGAPATAQRRVYASSFEKGHRSPPANPTRAGHQFTGWRLNGSDLDLDSPLTGTATGNTPVAHTVTATWDRTPPVQADDLTTLDNAITNCDGTADHPTRVLLTEDIPAPTATLATACHLDLDLDGHELAVQQLRIGSSTVLTLDDTAGGGALTSDATATPDAAGIRTTGAELVINDGTITATGAINGAGIGGGVYGNGGAVTINGGTVTATGTDRGAGIGGGSNGNAGAVTINGGTVTATGTDRGAGIGGGSNGHGSAVTINDGTVKATGHHGAGIGGGYNGNGGAVTINGGTVKADGGGYGAGIGGGVYGIGGAVTVNGGTVKATGGEIGAGIGGSQGGGGGTVTINGGTVTAAGGTVTAAGGARASAIGGGQYSSSFGTLTVGGTLHLPSGIMRVPNTDPGAEITVTTGGRILGAAGTPTTGATFTGNGQIDNQGAIALNPAAGGVTVTGNHHLVTFDSNGGSPTSVERRVYAPSFEAGHRSLPADPTRPGHQFTGWTLGGADLDRDTALPGTADAGPVPHTVTATWDRTPPVEVDTLAGLNDALTGCDGTKDYPTRVILTGDIPAPTSVLTTGCHVDLDLNGHTLAVQRLWVGVGTVLTLDDTAGSGALTADATATPDAAGIRTTGAELVINDGTITATGASNGAGIGGSTLTDGGTVTINGGTVTATGGTNAAGIGGGHSGRGGSVTINDGTVTATATYSAAGIGGGGLGHGGTVTINGGTVDASGGESAAGIGGGVARDGGSVTIAGGSVTATGANGGAGIGGGLAGEENGVPIGGNGATTAITGGTVTAIGGGDGSAIGGGRNATSFGTLTVGGTLHLPTGTMRVPDSAAGPEITVTDNGEILGASGTPATGATFTGDGEIDNQGVIALDPAAGGVTVTGNHHLVTFDGNGGTPASAQRRVYAPSFEAGYRSPPANPVRQGSMFTGWPLEGAAFEIDTVLTGSATDEPVAHTVTAGWDDLALDQPLVTGHTDGTAVFGATLSGSVAGVHPANAAVEWAWVRTPAVGPGTPIPGASGTGLSAGDYTPTAGDVGQRISLRVTVSHPDYAGSVVRESDRIAIAPATFTQGPTPTIEGTLKVGQRLTMNPGTITPAPDRLRLQWYADDDAIAGANSFELELTPALRGARISVEVTVTRPGHIDATETSPARGPVLPASLSVDQPTVTGTGVFGTTLAGALSGVDPEGTDVAWAWVRLPATGNGPGTVIDGATGTGLTVDNYTPTASNVGDRIALRVTITHDDYNGDLVRTSDPVTITPATFTQGPSPEVTGTLKVGQRLTANPGTITPAPDRLRLQWYADDAPITGADEDELDLTPALRGAQISVEVTATKAGHTDDTETSLPAGPVLPADLTVDRPVVTGHTDDTAVVGTTLSGTIDGVDPEDAEITWAWVRLPATGTDPGTPIDSAPGTGPNVGDYTITTADTGHRIVLRVTLTHPAYDEALIRNSEPVTIATPPVEPDPAAPTVQLTATKITLRQGKSLILRWQSTNAATLTSAGAWTGTRPTSGKLRVTPKRAGLHRYRLTATNTAGLTTTAIVEVLVRLPVTTFKIKTIKPKKARPGSRIRLRVTGLAAREHYSIQLAGSQIAQGRANRRGIVKIRLLIPTDTPTGTRRLRILGQDGYRNTTTHLTIHRRR